MNKRIKELAVQAGATVNERSGYTDYGTLDFDVEKFAELIIRQCLFTARAAECHHHNCGDKQKAFGAVTVQHYIKGHFGIDEFGVEE
jgi:hypothetical protein